MHLFDLVWDQKVSKPNKEDISESSGVEAPSPTMPSLVTRSPRLFWSFHYHT